MCRYRFGEERCSHPSNMVLECVGEDRCQFKDDGEGEIPSEVKDEDRIQNEQRSAGCSDTEIGIYCKKYGHFHCAGKENCQTRKEYIEHLKENKEAVQELEDVQNVNEGKD